MISKCKRVLSTNGATHDFIVLLNDGQSKPDVQVAVSLLSNTFTLSKNALHWHHFIALFTNKQIVYETHAL